MKKEEILNLIRSIELDEDLTIKDLEEIKQKLGVEIAIINSKIIAKEKKEK